MQMRCLADGFDASAGMDMKNGSGTTSQETNVIVIPPGNQQMQKCKAISVAMAPDSEHELGLFQT